MNFEKTKEQQDYCKEIINFAANSLNTGEYNNFSKSMWDKISEYGYFGITLGEEYGGLNEGYLTAAMMTEAFGYSCRNNGFIFVVNNHLWMAQNLIYLYGSKFLKDKYVERMSRGELIGAFALTEPDAGSDANSILTTARLEGDSYILNGNKVFISNGPIADVYIVFAATENAGKKEITAFVVERNFSGFGVGKEINKLGLDSSPTGELILQDCIVPKENILGQLHSGNSILMAALEWERCYEFAPHIGAMQRIMENCIEYASERRQFGKSLIEFQAVTHKIADMKMSIEMARLMLYKIAWLKDQRKSAYTESSVFKLYVSENYIKTCRDALQIYGAYGYTKEYEIERELRDALASSIYSGTSEMQRNTIFNMAAMDQML